MAELTGVRAYDGYVGVSSLRRIGVADGGGGWGRAGGGLEVVLMPLATSSTLLIAGGAGAEDESSLLSKAIRLDVLRGSGGLDEGATATGVGDGRDGDAP